MTRKTALLLIALIACATGFAQNITINRKNAALSSVMKEIERQTDYKFFYKQQLLKNAVNISIEVKDASWNLYWRSVSAISRSNTRS